MSEHMAPYCSNRIDLVTTVRCKDCVNWSGKPTDAVGVCRSFSAGTKAMDYCSRGRLQSNRKEVE